ncbi:MAG: hypothetical protein EOP51_17015 [Sphingobacteriales bacterium]|nr:MAG: hypothetical protein EOP51_17015 [Sphingobacteriales bacterium]
MKPVILFIAALFAVTPLAIAQELNYELSEPIEISKMGLDRIVMMKNGNTVLFHFELRKGIVVKVFDATHKEIASQKHLCKAIDINTLDLAELKAIEAIDNEAVLFITQEVDNKETLVRLRINANTGGLIAEDKLIQSESFKNATKTIVLKQPGIDTYYIVCDKVRPGFVENEIFVNQYDATHKLIGTVPLTIDQEGYDYIDMHNAQIDNEGGIAIAVEFGKIIQYPDINSRHIEQCYLFKNTKEFFIAKAELPSNYTAILTDLTFNPFEKNHNLLVSVNDHRKIEYGASLQDVVYQNHYVMITNDDLTSLKYVGLDNHKLQSLIGNALDTQQLFNGNTIYTSTSSNGISTVVYDGIIQHRDVFGLMNNVGYKHAIGITQYNAEGAETWSAVLPVSRLRNYEKYPSVFLGLGGRTAENNYSQFGSNYIAARNSNQISPARRQQLRNMGLADDESKAPCIGSEASICYAHTIAGKKAGYLFYNELDRNQTNQLAGFPDSIYNCEQSIACYSIINKKKPLTKVPLFGKKSNEFKQVIAGSGIYDTDKNLYVTLIRDRKGREVTSKIAWIQLEP